MKNISFKSKNNHGVLTNVYIQQRKIFDVETFKIVDQTHDHSGWFLGQVQKMRTDSL